MSDTLQLQPATPQLCGNPARSDRRLRVLFVTGWYPTREGPADGVFVRELAVAVRRTCDVAVLHCTGPIPGLSGIFSVEQERDAELTCDLPTWRVRCRSTGIPGLSYPIYLRGILAAFAAIRRAGFRPDVIHAHTYEPGFPATVLGRLHRIPVVISEHYSAFPLGRLPRREMLKARWAMRRAHRVLPVSAALEKALRRSGIQGNFEVVPNTVDPTLFFPPVLPRTAGDRRVLFVGRLADVKGVPVLLRAASRLSDCRSDWRLDIVGDGPERGSCERIARDAGLLDRVRFHGQLSKERIADLMRDADLFVLPSFWENMPCVLIEALASGLPVVASRVGGIPELVDDHNGILVEPGDEVALQAALARMLDSLHAFDRTRLSRSAEPFSHDSIGRRCHQIYRECVSE